MHNVVVTGGSRGIGLAISRRLAVAGYNVIAVARRESAELREATREVVKQGSGGLQFRVFDLSEVDAIPAFVKALRDEFGAVYGLVNNAGIGTEGLLATMHNRAAAGFTTARSIAAAPTSMHLSISDTCGSSRLRAS
jgi:3-oxoacyl-[acyl-carrier protein] reductase